MTGKRLEDSEVAVTSQDEEREAMARQRRNNILLGLLLGGLALFLLIFSFVYMLNSDIAPFADQDVFGGL